MPEVPKEVLLSCISYNVTVVEEMVMFSMNESVYGCHRRFSFNRKCNCWYLDTCGNEELMMSHVVGAYELVCKWFGGSFEGKRGEYKL